MNTVIDFINTHRDRYIDELKAFLAIPSISALPEHAADTRRCAEWTAEEMRRIGLQNVRLLEDPAAGFFAALRPARASPLPATRYPP